VRWRATPATTWLRLRLDRAGGGSGDDRFAGEGGGQAIVDLLVRFDCPEKSLVMRTPVRGAANQMCLSRIGCCALRCSLRLSRPVEIRTPAMTTTITGAKVSAVSSTGMPKMCAKTMAYLVDEAV
jgi:hypothetical protein